VTAGTRPACRGREPPEFRGPFAAKETARLAEKPRPREARLHNLPSLTLTEIKTEIRADVISDASMGNLVFKCPRTGMNVQHWLADEAEPAERRHTHETVVCKACSRLHFINRSSGKLLGQQEG
jgi:hypothetical protein